MQNPELQGTNIIDCIPQTGLCPNKCLECFYNDEGFYRTKDQPLIPSISESENKIVRFNSGHDSNIEKEKVIEISRNYKHFFFNTAIQSFDFPGPVVFTCDPHEKFQLVSNVENLMFVRIRLTTWNVKEAKEVVDYYNILKVPVVLTFMRFKEFANVQEPEKYTRKTHILNSYYCITPENYYDTMLEFVGTGARSCGTIASSLCKDCGNCENLYWKFLATH